MRTYVIALLPQYGLNNSVKVLNKQLDKYRLEFLFDSNATPHLSLYMLQINIQDVDEVVLKVSTIASREYVIELDAYDWHIQNRYLAMKYIKTKAITELQKNIIEEVNPLRGETHPDSLLRLKGASPVQRYNIEQYGWAMIGEEYYPHMTIARFLEEVQVVDSLPASINMNGSFDKLALFEMGDNGTAWRQIAVFSLKIPK